MDKSKSVGTKVGELVANVFVGCVGVCISAVLIALTVRFIMWVF